jgi:hypothetical protein
MMTTDTETRQPDPHPRPEPQHVPPTPDDVGEPFFDKNGAKAVYYRKANVVVLYVDGQERGWWNATYWNQAEIGILAAPNVVRLQQGTFPIVDFPRGERIEPVEDELFPPIIKG